MDSSAKRLNNSNMPSPATAARDQASTAGLPSYALYGERGRSSATDWLHCESIAERSRRHDWEIRPHRHAALCQILYIRRGAAQAWLDGASLPLCGPALLLVPALVPHGFRFAPDIDGCVLTMLEQHLSRLLAPVPALAERLRRPLALRLSPGSVDAGAIDDAVRRLQAEFQGTLDFRDLALDAGLLALAVQLARLLPDAAHPPAAGAPCALAHVQRLRAMVELRFRTQPTMASLAAELDITPTQLNRVCRQVLGHPALEVLHGRIVLEAQRDLTYTALSIQQVAFGLGFGDAGYFTRFFRRETGHTPGQWRALAVRSQPLPGAGRS